MAGTCRENGSGSDAKEDDGRKTVYRTKERKTSFEMDGWWCSRLVSSEDKAVDREDERQRAMETGCWGGQGSPRAVAPRGRKEYYIKKLVLLTSFYSECKKQTCYRSSYLGTGLGSWPVSQCQSSKWYANKGPWKLKFQVTEILRLLFFLQPRCGPPLSFDGGSVTFTVI